MWLRLPWASRKGSDMPRIFSVNIGAGGGGGGVLVARSGQDAISSGSNTIAVAFSSDIGTTNYSIKYSIVNDTDVDPIMLQGVVTTKLSSGFTVTFNTPTDTANYSIDWDAVVYV